MIEFHVFGQSTINVSSIGQMFKEYILGETCFVHYDQFIFALLYLKYSWNNLGSI